MDSNKLGPHILTDEHDVSNSSLDHVIQDAITSGSEVPSGASHTSNLDNTGRFICPECGKDYKTNSHMTRHRKTHAAPQYACGVPGCDKKFHRPDNQKSHEKNHWRAVNGDQEELSSPKRNRRKKGNGLTSPLTSPTMEFMEPSSGIPSHTNSISPGSSVMQMVEVVDKSPLVGGNISPVGQIMFADVIQRPAFADSLPEELYNQTMYSEDAMRLTQELYTESMVDSFHDLDSPKIQHWLLGKGGTTFQSIAADPWRPTFVDNLEQTFVPTVSPPIIHHPALTSPPRPKVSGNQVFADSLSEFPTAQWRSHLILNELKEEVKKEA